MEGGDGGEERKERRGGKVLEWRLVCERFPYVLCLSV